MNDSILIYQTQDGSVRTEVTLKNESVWLTQIQLSELFGTKRPAVTKHLGQIFKNHELCEKAVCSILERTAGDGKRYKTKLYNLDAIIAVGYRVNSKQATQFSIWANSALRDYLIKGYALDEQRLKTQSRQIKELEKTRNLFQKAQSKILSHSEASGILLDLHAKRLEIRCGITNVRSKKIPERLRFHLETTLKKNRINPQTQAPRDTVIYALYNLDSLPALSVHWPTSS